MRHSTRCFTASKPIAPSRRASPTAPSTSSSRKVSSRREHLDVLALACLAHTSFEEPPQSDEGLGQVPARQWRGLVEGADLLLDQGQVMQRVEDQVLAVVGPAVPGDHLGPAADHHLIDVAPDEHLTVAVGHGHGIVVAAVTHQRQRTRPSRALIAGIIGSRRQWQENLTIPLETLADGLLVAPQPRRLAPAALFGESIVEGREALGTRDGDQEVPPDEADQSLDLALVVALARPAELVLEQIVGLKLREDARSLPLPIAQDPGNRQLGVVVQDGSGGRRRRRQNAALWPSQNASVVSAG